MSIFRKKKKNLENKKEEKECCGHKKEKARVVIRYDVGYDNQLFIRGNGAGLNWDQGVMLKNVGADEWVWEANVPFKECEFKVLINDQQYESGDNHHLHDGIVVQYTPKF